MGKHLPPNGLAQSKELFGLKGTDFCRWRQIWLHGPIVERLTECRVLFEGAFRTHADDPATYTFSGHLPVMARFA